MTTIELTNEEALLFLEFQKHYLVIAPVAGYLSSIQTKDLSNSQIVLDIDSNQQIKHVSITKHFRT